MKPSPGRRSALAAMLLVAACQPLPHPFADDVPKPGSPMLFVRDTATVAVAPLQGEPRATAQKLAPAMAAALQKHEIPASSRTMSLVSYHLEGRLQAMPPAGGKAAIVVLWDLRDPSGKSLGERAERIEAAPGDWQQGKDDAVTHLAEASADQIAAMLQDQKPVESPEQGRVRLLIGRVEGAPGDGGTTLPGAIAALLKKQDVTIVSDPEEKADLLLDAVVTVDKPIAGKQHVKIVWRIRRKSGDEIGTVGQENDVPAGLLNGPWSDVAYNIALAAQDAIMQLIARGSPNATGSAMAGS